MGLCRWRPGTFRLIRCAFGDERDCYRQRAFEGGERERALHLFAALAGLPDHATGGSVEDALGRQVTVPFREVPEAAPSQSQLLGRGPFSAGLCEQLAISATALGIGPPIVA